MASLNLPLKTAIIETRKKQHRIARLARISETKLSKIVHGRIDAEPEERERLSRVLGKPESELFPEALAS